MKMHHTTSILRHYLLNLQKNICETLEKEESSDVSFKKDSWKRPNKGGGGLTCALENGNVIEKAGVNFSHIYGQGVPGVANTERAYLSNYPFQALGVSVIIHPRNPFAPTTHFNVRFFLAEKKDKAPVWWFAGGFDLTPYYGFIEDCTHFHKIAKEACDLFGENLYPRFKKAADEYFYLPHRQEPRGIGGIFFENFTELGFERSFEFMKSIGDHFMLAYQPILNRRKNLPFGDAEREFQTYRRGRYVEFNLLYDRGTKFGIEFGGRTESILISLPPEVAWRYDWHPRQNSEEEKLYEFFLKPRDWIMCDSCGKNTWSTHYQ